MNDNDDIFLLYLHNDDVNGINASLHNTNTNNITNTNIVIKK